LGCFIDTPIMKSNYEVGQCYSGHLCYLGLLRLEGGHWVAY